MQTLAILKPDVVKSNNHMKILKEIIDNKFVVKSFKTHQLKLEQAQEFYFVHKDKKFFDELVNFMISGPCCLIVLEENNAVFNWRELMLNLREKYGTDIMNNAVHGSDSEENAKVEVEFFNSLS